MIERILLQYLHNKGFAVYLEMPTTLPDEFIIIEKTGSNFTNQVTRSTIAIQSYSTTLANAIELNEDVKEAVLDIVELANIGGCDLVSDYNFTDTSIKRYRYQAVFEITHY